MATFVLGGKTVNIPAVPIALAATSDRTAWQFGQHLTVRLTGPMSSLRVHTNGKGYPGRKASAEAGAWIALGDVIQTSSELADSRSLPVNDPGSMSAFTHTSVANLQAGCVLNIGLASAKFGGRGGEFQAEFIGGPPIQFSLLTGKHWHGRAGNA